MLVSRYAAVYLCILERDLNALILWMANYDVSSYHTYVWIAYANLSLLLQYSRDKQDKYTLILDKIL